MVDIHHSGTAEVPLSFAFAYLDDHRNTTSWMFGLSGFTPVTDVESGVGAEFEGTFAVPPVKLRSTIRVTQWEPDELISFSSIKGFRNWSTWRFRDDGPSRSTIEVIFGYELPGGLAGRALGRALEPIVGLSVRQSDVALRRNLESAYAEVS